MILVAERNEIGPFTKVSRRSDDGGDDDDHGVGEGGTWRVQLLSLFYGLFQGLSLMTYDINLSPKPFWLQSSNTSGDNPNQKGQDCGLNTWVRWRRCSRRPCNRKRSWRSRRTCRSCRSAMARNSNLSGFEVRNKRRDNLLESWGTWLGKNFVDSLVLRRPLSESSSHGASTHFFVTVMFAPAGNMKLIFRHFATIPSVPKIESTLERESIFWANKACFLKKFGAN